MKKTPTPAVCLFILAASGFMACKPKTQDPEPLSRETAAPAPDKVPVSDSLLASLTTYYKTLGAASAAEVGSRSANSRFAGHEVVRYILDSQKLHIVPNGSGYRVLATGHLDAQRNGESLGLGTTFYNELELDAHFRVLAQRPAPASPELQELAAGLSAALSSPGLSGLVSFIEPGQGMIFLNRAGAFDEITLIRKPGDLLAVNPWLTEKYANMACTLSEGGLPAFECEAGYAAQGCYAAPYTYNRLSQIMRTLQEMEIRTYPQSLHDLAAQYESQISHAWLHTDKGGLLLLARLNGSWRVLIWDEAIFDCSA